MRIRSKVIILINVMVAAILTILAVLNYFKFQNLLSDYTSSRISVLSEEVRSTIINAENLGLNIQESIKFRELLTKISKTETDIVYIVIFTENGEVIFKNLISNGPVNDEQIRSSLAKARASKKWTLQNNNVTEFGELIFKNLTNENIYITFGYRSSIFTKYYSTIRNRLLFGTLLVILISTVSLGLVNFFVFRPLQNLYNQIRNSSEKVFSGSTIPDVEEMDEFGNTLKRIRLTLIDALKSRGGAN